VRSGAACGRHLLLADLGVLLGVGVGRAPLPVAVDPVLAYERLDQVHGRQVRLGVRAGAVLSELVTVSYTGYQLVENLIAYRRPAR
jgi:hypothetical protein